MGIERHEGYWLWVGGPVPRGSDAITIWSVISMRRGSVGDERLLRHELVHVRQWHELGPRRFITQYVGAYLRLRRQGLKHRAAYLRIPFEEEARREAAEGGGS